MSNAMTEFRITSDLSALRSQIISANFDEVREWLNENLAPYRDMAVTPDEIPTAKTYRANIRKVKDRIEQSRKEAKAAALAAYSDFEAKCKELTGLCDDAANSIDEQVKAIEEAEKQEKLEKLHAEYVAMTDDETETYCPWELIFNEKWGNKGYSFEKAQDEISAALSATRTDLSTIRDVGGADTAYLLDVYKQTHDIGAVIRKSSEIKALREQEASRKSEEDESLAILGVAEDEPRVTVVFKVECTKAQLSALGEYMKRNGIKYGRA
jgi:hypothetical protein